MRRSARKMNPSSTVSHFLFSLIFYVLFFCVLFGSEAGSARRRLVRRARSGFGSGRVGVGPWEGRRPSRVLRLLRRSVARPAFQLHPEREAHLGEDLFDFLQ